MRITIFISIISLLFSCNLHAETSLQVNAEIQQLLEELEVSGCQFNRNGSWYSSSDAKTHLQRKLDYLNRKGTINNTEQFIELAASKSSSSGKPYLVKCNNNTASNSQVWLINALSRLRKQSK